jgi:uncharacterized protein (DUF433 family)
MGATRRKQPHAQKKLGDPASSAELAALRARFARIVSQNPQILGGEPVFTGTRVPVKSLFDHLEAGDSIEDFLDGFPSVKREQVIAVIEAAKLRMLGASRMEGHESCRLNR